MLGSSTSYTLPETNQFRCSHLQARLLTHKNAVSSRTFFSLSAALAHLLSRSRFSCRRALINSDPETIFSRCSRLSFSCCSSNSFSWRQSTGQQSEAANQLRPWKQSQGASTFLLARVTRSSFQKDGALECLSVQVLSKYIYS